ncbi:MAG TPA: BadF/BadG/BcrA/BcrD ATPase family protein [Ktedonobacterales bacterium]
MRYVIGVDGGGTKTNAVVLGEDVGVSGMATTGPANQRSVGMEAASANIAQAVLGAIQASGLSLAQISAITMCLAGFDTDLDLPVPQRAMRTIGYTGPTIIENDVVGAWAGATEANAGVVMIAGTGATGLGMNARGELWRTDGWDYILGDAGSGYAIGLEAIRAAMRMLDGREKPSPLLRELRVVYGVDSAEDMRRLVDSMPFGKFEIAAFSAKVWEVAEQGDTAAQGIFAEAGRRLGESARAIIEMLAMQEDTFPVSTVGSVFKSEPWVTEPFRQIIHQAAPHALFRPPVHPPEVGAALLALRRLDDDDIGSWTLGTGKRHIRRSLKISELFPA